MIELEYIEHKIEKLLYEMSSIYADIQFKGEFSSPDDTELLYEISDLEDSFAYLADRVYKMCIAYLETKQLKELIGIFKSEVLPNITDKKKLLSGTFNQDNAEVYSDLTSIFWSYLLAFPAFGDNDTEILLKRTGITFLENILESTGVIIKELNITPTTETQVYDAVKILTQATFPSASFPSQSFQKTAKCYIPDILLPTLNCTVEYKYADTERKLIDTIDQILIDVKGYDKHQFYKLFYAVFYVKPGIWTKTRFDTVWKEKEFPENWKGILVVGQ
jgi:uncharacterized protein (DUF1810 family)